MQPSSAVFCRARRRRRAFAAELEALPEAMSYEAHSAGVRAAPLFRPVSRLAVFMHASKKKARGLQDGLTVLGCGMYTERVLAPAGSRGTSCRANDLHIIPAAKGPCRRAAPAADEIGDARCLPINADT